MNSNWSYSLETAKLGYDLCDLDLWPVTLTFCMDITFVIGNNSWKFCVDTTTGTWWKRCDRQTDWRTERGVLRAAWSQLKSSGNPIFSQIFGHQRAENEARNKKMYRGQETHHIRVNATYEMNWAKSFLKKVPETPFSAKYLATRGPKMRLGTRKCIGVKRLTT